VPVSGRLRVSFGSPDFPLEYPESKRLPKTLPAFFTPSRARFMSCWYRIRTVPCLNPENTLESLFPKNHHVDAWNPAPDIVGVADADRRSLSINRPAWFFITVFVELVDPR